MNITVDVIYCVFPIYYGLLVAVYAYIVYTDFYYFRIPNAAVGVLALIFAAIAITTNFANAGFDLALAAALFLVTFIFWLLRLMGAGDVKLISATALVVGFNDAIQFAVLLVIFSLIFLWILRGARMGQIPPIGPLFRLIEISGQKRIPHGVPVAFAAVAIFTSRLFC